MSCRTYAVGGSVKDHPILRGITGDFENVQVRRIVEQMILWAADHPEMIPADGLKCEIPAEWSAPATR